MPKTATTLLQDRLFARHSQIYYFGKFNGQGFLPSVISVLQTGIDMSVQVKPNDIRAASLAEQIAYAEKNHLTPVLSKEGLAGGPFRQKQEQCKTLAKHFGPCIAIIFVREPADFIKSFYIQMLKGFNTRVFGRPGWMQTLGKPPHYFDINEWLNAAWQSGSTPKDYLAYADTADVYASFLGRENIRIYLYEEFTKHPKNVISQLCKDMGIDSDEGLKLIDGRRANDRLTTGYIGKIKALEKSLIKKVKYRWSSQQERREILFSSHSAGEKINPEITDQWLEKIHAIGDEQNRRLIEEWGLSLGEHGYRS